MNIIQPAYPNPTGPYTQRDMAGVEYFVVHHSAGPLDQTPLEIDTFERSRGDIFMPYTWLIDTAGNVYDGRPYTVVSAASYGLNSVSVAVCCIGNYEASDAGFTGEPSADLLASLLSLRVYAQGLIPALSHTIAHGDIAAIMQARGLDPGDYATACCGSALRAQLPDLRVKAAKLLGHG